MEKNIHGQKTDNERTRTDKNGQNRTEGLTIGFPKGDFTDDSLANLEKILAAKEGPRCGPAHDRRERRRVGVLSLVGHNADNRWGDGILRIYRGGVQAGQKRQKGHGKGNTGREREVRFQNLPAAAGVHWTGSQGRTEDPAFKALRIGSVRKRGRGSGFCGGPEGKARRGKRAGGAE